MPSASIGAASSSAIVCCPTPRSPTRSRCAGVDGVAQAIIGPGIGAFPIGISDTGVVVGNAYPPDVNPFAFVWRDGVLDRLDDFSGYHFVLAAGINRHDDIVGYGFGPVSAPQALVLGWPDDDWHARAG